MHFENIEVVMGRIVAIASGDLESTKVINEYAVNMISGESKNVLFIGTASRDSEGYIESFTMAFSEIACSVRALKLTTEKYSYEKIIEMVSWADIIYVGGGDTIFMMNIWKEYGLDKILKEIYKNDRTVLMGISAGAICWFNCGCTDSELALVGEGTKYGWANDMLNLHNYAYCPHYEDRVEDFGKLMKEKNINGLAMESNTAFVEENGKIYFIKGNEEYKVYTYKYKDGKCEKKEVDAMLIK